MLGWRIFKHAIGMVFRNFSVALRISALLWLLAGGLILWWYGQGLDTAPTGGTDMVSLRHSLWTWAIGMTVAQVLITAWIAVGWHRYILLSEEPGAVLPRLHVGKILVYILTAFLIGVVLGLAALVFFLIMTLVSALFGGVAVYLSLPLGLVFALFASVLSIRLSLALPAVAIGENLLFGEAWSRTEGYTGAIIVVAILSGVFQQLLGLPALLPGLSPVMAMGLALVAHWLATLVAISILTTLYGVIIQGRSLD